MNVLAHGLGGRTDLPLNGTAAVIGGGIVVAASFLALAKLWTRPWLDPNSGKELSWARVADSAVLRRTCRIIALALSLGVVAVAFLGPPETERNLAPWALYVTFWVGLVPVSALFGPVWRIVNPLRALHIPNRRPPRPMPSWLGYWPAAGWLAAFVWLELVVPERADPRLVGWVLVGYAAINLAAARVYGPAWFARGDGFEVYSTLIAELSPIGRRDDGTFVLRNPLAGLVRTEIEPGLTALACVLVGGTAFDGLTRTTFWTSTGWLTDTIGLAGSIAAVSVLYWGAMRVSRRISRADHGLAEIFAPTLLPIALGYAIAHYFSFFLLEGQNTLILASDPFGTGLDLLGLSGHSVNYGLLTPEIVAMVQINAIVLGHIASTAAAHDQALRLFTPELARRGQIPVVLAMVLLTSTGLLLLLSG
ncbi:hypothetical protein [Saccharopolyspora rectivirgula]|uniref:Fenitrothion hydrolase n=1 Tax=Saccharopolyspora rectivirgula TaxID=28042 RepID=A0A073AVI9_9PSEU|nr:hypothetical protein [Saccharopolyspora rectivirgula]KEI43410.1 hypothetical protein GU90_16830 [Saccharopolyspora rectivirgula]